MKTLNKIGIGAALVGSTLAFSTVGISSAQAAVFGTFDITGTTRIVGNEQIVFSNARVEDTAPLVNSFTPLANTVVTFSPIALSNAVFNGMATTTFTGNVTNPFMTFASDLRFTADNPFSVTLTDLTDGVAFAAAPINGTFTNADGVSTGKGVATFNFIDTFGSFSLTLEATPIPTDIPEPTTTLGLAALGLGAFFSKSMAKKKKERVSA